MTSSGNASRLVSRWRRLGRRARGRGPAPGRRLRSAGNRPPLMRSLRSGPQRVAAGCENICQRATNHRMRIAPAWITLNGTRCAESLRPISGLTLRRLAPRRPSPDLVPSRGGAPDSPRDRGAMRPARSAFRKPCRRRTDPRRRGFVKGVRGIDSLKSMAHRPSNHPSRRGPREVSAAGAVFRA